jgi:hypothetical protein
MMCSTWLATSEIRLAVPHQDPEAIGRPLDVVEQRQRRGFEDLVARSRRGQGIGDRPEKALDLAIDHHGIQTLLAAEVFVDNGFGDSRLGRDLLDGGALEALVGEQAAPDPDQLLSPLTPGHAGSRARDLDGLGFWGHRAIVPGHDSGVCRGLA